MSDFCEDSKNNLIFKNLPTLVPEALCKISKVLHYTGRPNKHGNLATILNGLILYLVIPAEKAVILKILSYKEITLTTLKPFTAFLIIL